ncbi:MAG: hypothetical protein IT288_16920 [Bdellovibrionales bacterium]|nr:hypothetical protein [Bdellovibrionales bacterium]
MKKILVLAIIMLASSAWAKSSLRIPVMTEEGVTAAQLNVKLKAKGLSTLPLYFEISTDDLNKAYEKHEQVSAAVAKATKALGSEEYLRSENIPNSDMRGTCYTGQGGQPVVDLVFALAGSFYTEQMNLWGWKFKKAEYINTEYGDDPAETAKILNQRSKLWRDWRGTGEAMLVVIAYSDDGDDVNESLIFKCK